jgi:uncharacterized membrane protein HdeD (DUF308 family)
MKNEHGIPKNPEEARELARSLRSQLEAGAVESESEAEERSGGRWPLVGVCAAVGFVFGLAFAWREGRSFGAFDALAFGTLPYALGSTLFLVGVPALAAHFAARGDDRKWRSNFITLFIFLLALIIFARVFVQ